LNGQIYKDIKKSYTGGACDVYKPYGLNIKALDVNSLYPSEMEKNKMPVGNVTYFEGDIFEIDKDAFGFFEVEIISPSYSQIPLIQTKIKVKSESRTIAPLGI
jgi:hypothetical protein